ncbi:MAG TPA: hypothetical protein VFY20_13275 [Gemmatimonadales bacterium]|nr:hypothetical protein [Gemmatimonadales bacterium]
MTTTVQVNRAPVLTLWATVVAERLGHPHEEALSLGRAVAGLNAQSKGRRLGIYEGKDEPARKAPAAKKAATRTRLVEILGRQVPVTTTKQGDRAVLKDAVIEPKGVERYLAQKFGDALDDVTAAMKALAKAYTPRQLGSMAYVLYERFRPEIPAGARGWGAKGPLDVARIRAMASRADEG